MTAGHDRTDLARLKRGAAAWLSFIALLWLIQVLASVGDWDRAALAVRPHEAAGLVGVLTAPLIHGSVQHLLSNSLALGVIGTALVVGWPRASRWVVPLIWVGSGLAVWLFAREAAHLGASGLAYGMMFFVLVAGIARRDSRSVALVLIVLFLHGGMIWGILPLQAGVSFESHLAGAVWGCLCALAMRERRGPRPRPRKYQWEGKAIDDEHPAADLFRAPGDDRPDGRH